MAIQEADEFVDPEWSLGERMRKAREWAGISIPEMAAEMGVSEGAISTWETGTRQPRRLFERIKQWSRITRVRQDWILGSASENPRPATVVHSPFDQRLFDPDAFEPTDSASHGSHYSLAS